VNPIDAFVRKHRELLRLERDAEIKESRRLRETLSPAELERLGVSLSRLRVGDVLFGLGGRTLLALEPSRGGELPAHRFEPGDIVALSESGASKRADPAPTGVVYRVGERRITIALDEDPEEDFAEPLRLLRVANDVTYRRLESALESLRAYERGPASRLRDLCFGLRDPRAPEPPPDWTPLDAALDASQREAVALALGAQDLALVHGPPGTGKTTTLVETIRQAVRRRERVLACAPSNIAVDNLVERLAGRGVRVARLGHPARFLPAVEEHSLDALLERAEGTRLAQGVRRDIEQALRRVRRSGDRAERRRLKDELTRLRGELRDLEDRALRDVLASTEVVLATNVGAASRVLDRLDFDLVVIDEAAQALEASSWIPLLKGRRAVLAGDNLQLPPTVRSREAERGGLAVTLFDRLMGRFGESCSRLLSTQYRMHEAIMRWPSEELYGGRLVAHASVRAHRLADLPGVEDVELTRAPLVFIDTAGCDFEEAVDERGESRSNEGEARLVERHVRALAAAGVPPAAIAVITPYNAQVELLRRRLGAELPGLEIDSVDGFQGREKEAVVISWVRSNPRREVGFLADDRRSNVAVTRARRHLALIGDSATISAHPFLARLAAYCQAHGDYRSAWELAD
jgi:ATP-dependent RNA/DNA helicase IGHMBP2